MNKKFEELSPLERAIIGIEKRRWKYQGSKEKTIGALGITPSAYYQKLNTMIDDPRVIAAEPILTARLREHRDQQSRFGGVEHRAQRGPQGACGPADKLATKR